MATQPTPYINVNPGDLILAEDIDSMQVQIKQDIASQVAAAVSGITKVAQAGDAGTVGGQTAADIAQAAANIVLGQLAKKGGPQILFKRLSKGQPSIIAHNRGSFSAVDAYELAYFKVICPEDENTRRIEYVNFYLYHSTEKRIRTVAYDPSKAAGPTNPGQVTVEIEPADQKQQYKIKFIDMLQRYGIKWDDTTILDVLVSNFWSTFFSDPNDAFDQDQYCLSPWFLACCKEQRTMGALKGELDNLWFKMEPQKTINYDFAGADQTTKPPTAIQLPDPLPTEPTLQNPPSPIKLAPYGYQLPHNIEIVHYDFNTLGVELVADPVYPAFLTNTNPDGSQFINKDELKVMLILCC